METTRPAKIIPVIILAIFTLFFINVGLNCLEPKTPTDPEYWTVVSNQAGVFSVAPKKHPNVVYDAVATFETCEEAKAFIPMIIELIQKNREMGQPEQEWFPVKCK